MIDITNRKDITERLHHLKAEAIPLFGKMTSQHMVEHLTLLVKCSNGKLPQKLYFPEEKARLFKEATIYSDKELIRGFKAPMLGEGLPELTLPDLPSAITELFSELDEFDRYFSENKEAKPISPVLGELSYREWIIFHNKHFTPFQTIRPSVTPHRAVHNETKKIT